MAIKKGDGLYWKTGLDNTGLKKGSKQAKGILANLTKQITGMDVFAGLGIAAALAFKKISTEAWNMAKDLDLAMREVQTISTAAQNDFDGMKDAVIEMSKKVPEGATKLTKALYQIVSAGYDGEEGLNLLAASAKAAVAGVSDTTTAADGLTTVMNAWKIAAEDVEMVSDIMFQTVKLGKTTFDELAGSISNVAALAASSGISFEEISAAVATLTKQGVPTAMAMTQIRSALLGMTKTLGDGWTATMTFQEGVAEIRKQAKGSQNELREMIGRVEGVNAVLSMTGKNAEMAAADLKAMYESAGASTKAFDLMTLAAKNQIELLKNKWHAKLITMGDSLVQVFGKVAIAINAKDRIKNLQDEGRQVTLLISELNKANISEGDRLKILEKLEKISPGITEGLEGEEGAYTNLNTVLEKYNTNLIQRIQLETLSAEEAKKAARVARLEIKKQKLENEIQLFIDGVDRRIAVLGIGMETKLRTLIKTLEEKLSKPEDLLSIDRHKYTRQLRLANFALDQLTDAQYKYDTAVGKTEDLKKRNEEMLKSLGIFEKAKKASDEGGGKVVPVVTKILGIEELEKEIKAAKEQYEGFQKLKSAGLEKEAKEYFRYLQLQSKNYAKYLKHLYNQYKEHQAQKNLIAIKYADELNATQTEREEEFIENTQDQFMERIGDLQNYLDEHPVEVGLDMKGIKLSQKELEAFSKILDKLIKKSELQALGDQFYELGGLIGMTSDIVAKFDTELAQMINEFGRMVSGASNVISNWGSNWLGVVAGILEVILSIVNLVKGAEEDIKNYRTDYEYLNDSIDAVNRSLEYQLELIGQLRDEDWVGGIIDQLERYDEEINDVLEDLQKLRVTVAYQDPIGIITHKDVSTEDWTREDWIKFLGGLLKPTDFEDIVPIQGPTGMAEPVWFSVSAEERQLIETYLDRYDELIQARRDMLVDIQEELTGTTTDALIDTIVSSFEEGKLAAADFADTFEELMQKALVNSFKRKYLVGELDKWYADWYELSKDGLDAGEIDQIRGTFEGIIEAAKLGWEEMKSIFPDFFGEDFGEKAQGLAGAIKGVTEETAGIIAGQMMAIRFNILESMEIAEDSLDALNDIRENTSFNKYLKDIYSKMDESQTTLKSHVF